MMSLARKTLSVAAVVTVLGGCAILAAGQSATLNQQVNQRDTIGILAGTPTTGVHIGSTVNFNYQIYTAGAPAPTSDTVQFFDGANALSSPLPITMVSASNLLPYSQVNLSNGWTATGSAPTVTPQAANGPDGSTNTAATIVFPNTTTGSSGITFAVPLSTSYAGQPMTFSFWAIASAGGTITVGLTDSPQVAASNSNTCAVTSSWQRCTLTYTFPANAGTGFAASIVSSGVPAQTVSVWGGQVEQAAQAGPYVSTIGSARPTGAQAGTASLGWSQFLDGSHVITVQFAGDANYVASTSNSVTINVAKGNATIALAANPVSPSVYGTAITFSATLTGPDTTPTGTVQFLDGTTVLGQGTISNGIASLTLQGATALPVGTHSITAVYSGDNNFNTVTSNAMSYVVTQLPATSLTVTIASSLNPSAYGDPVALTVVVASPVGVMPTGTVTFTDTTTSATLGTGSLDATGKTSVTVPATAPGLFTAGSHNITAKYNGDNNYQ